MPDAMPGEQATSVGGGALGELLALWPALLVSLGLAIMLATGWRLLASRRGSAGSDGADAARVAADLRELGSKLAEELDARADRIAMLMKHADRRIRRLEELLEAAGALEAADPDEGYVDDRAEASPVVTRADVAGRIAPVRERPRGLALDPIAEQVFALADAGQTTLQIAQRLGQPAGHVDLILKLRR